jgi:uncharacterized low-complexity protein
MTNKTSLKLALGTTFAATIALGAVTANAENPFTADTLSSGYMQLAENKAGGEMKCGAGMCGANMKTAAASSDGMPCPADTDKDGNVAKEEYLKHHEAMFDAADANKDGALDKAEQGTLHTNMRAMMGAKMGSGTGGGAKTDDAVKTDTAAPAAAPAATDKPAEEKK